MTLLKQLNCVPMHGIAPVATTSLQPVVVFQLLFAIASVNLLAVEATAQKVEWIRQFGTETADEAVDIALGPQGQIYATGYWAKGEFPDGDGFLIEYGADGDLVRTHHSGTSERDVYTSVTVNADGNVLVGGGAVVSFGGPVLDLEGFVSNYDDEFQLQWHQPIDVVAAEDEIKALDTDAAGFIYALGNTDGRLPGATAHGGLDMFIAKYDADRTIRWLRQIGSNELDLPFSLTCDGFGNIYIGGYTDGSWGGRNQGYSDAILAKYDDAGNQQWVRQFGGNFIDVVLDLATDETGNIYVSGSIGESVSNGDAFLAKYDAAGTQQWVQQLATSGLEQATSVTVNEQLDGVVVAGYSEGDLFGPSQGGSDIFVAQYDFSGNLQWGLQRGTSEDDFAWGVVTDNEGDIFVTGSTKGSFGGPSAGGPDGFIFKVSAVAGDYNRDGVLNVADIDLQAQEMIAPNPDLRTFDENDDGVVDMTDRLIWVHDHADTWVGDANLDGEFNSGDLIAVFDAGKYEQDVPASWLEGDWDGDTRFGTGDLVVAFVDGGFEQGSLPSVRAVPEPTAAPLLIVGAIFARLFCGRRK